jgi:hypothetical protein
MPPRIAKQRTLITTCYPLPHPRNESPKVVDSFVMDTKQLQNIEKRLNDQAEATQATNKTLNKLLAAFSAQEAREHLMPPPPDSLPPVTTPLKALSHPNPDLAM